MSNETKQNVFEDAAFNIETSAPDGPKFADELRQRYDAALPDDLPVIPQAVGEYIKANRGHMSLTSGIENASCISEWLWGKGFDYGNDSVFARAWVLGVWRIQETGEIVKLEAEK
ncbi:hypothetical protein [Lacticaseibacillus rhamnosus]|uniref:hypothetical protein n=1 Tax=Lacticaseibacillus rhamnosus TaxID=47715 RepID=UPI003DA84855